MKNSEVNNERKNKYDNLRTILSIWFFNRNIFSYGRFMKHKCVIYSHVEMKQWGFNFKEIYAPVVNCLNVMSLLDIASIHAFPSRSIDFVPAFPQYELDVDVFMEIPLVMVVDVNIR